LNPLYKSYQESRAQNDPPANLGMMLQNFASQYIPQGMTAEQMTRQLIQSGQMTQAQFNQLAAIADKWTGRKR